MDVYSDEQVRVIRGQCPAKHVFDQGANLFPLIACVLIDDRTPQIQVDDGLVIMPGAGFLAALKDPADRIGIERTIPE